ncbi:MAG: creatininase family protein [Acidobacteria bacterium]|nr:creatininase family protein [Acidobacteriota bacterium]
MTLRSVWLQELTWEDVRDYLQGKNTIVVPFGTTEQHGPAGPLGLDSYVAIGLAEDAAKQAGVLVAPPLWYGDSSHHLGFPGTISLRTETVIQIVYDIVRSLAKHGFRRILLLNGHKMTNLPALTSAARNIREFELPGVLTAVADPMYLARGIAGGLKETNEHHAGELEVSQVYYKFPHVIHPEKFSQAHCNFEGVFGPFGGGDLFGGGGRDFIEQPWTSGEQREIAPTGQFSSNVAASQEKGKWYHEYMVTRLVEFLNWWQAYKGPLGKGTS